MNRPAIVASVLGAVVACACGPPVLDTPEAARETATTDRRLIVLAVDGLDPGLLDRLVAEGQLPEMASLLEEGLRIPLESEAPMNSPALWTTMATGVRRELHGVLDFVYLPEEGEKQLPTHSGTRLRPALWEIFSFLNRPSSTVGWFVSWPAPQVQGALVTDRYGLGLAEEESPSAWPPALGRTDPSPGGLEDLGAELERLLVEVPGSPDPGLRPEKGVVQRARKYLETDLSRARMSVALARSLKTGIDICYLQSADALSHFYWKYLEPGAGKYAGAIDPQQQSRMADAIPATYRLADRVLGELRDAAGRDAAVILVSDHGFQPFVQPYSILVKLDLLLEHLGYLRRNSKGQADVAASILVPGEGTGIVDPFGERDRFLYYNPEASGAPPLEELIADLRDLRTNSRAPFFERVEPYEAAAAEGVDAPDIRVRVNFNVLRDRMVADLKRKRTIQIGPPLIYEFDDISGTHRKEAVLVVRAPGFEAGRTASASLQMVDVHALISWLAGVPIASDVQGEVPGSLRAEETPELFHVPSYRDWIDRTHSHTTHGVSDDAMLERLRSLGYVNE